MSSSPGQGWKERTRPRATDGHREDESISAPVAVRQELNRLLHCEAASALKSAKIYNSRLSINIISQRSHSKGCRRHADSQLPQKDVAYEERHLSSSCPGTAPPPNTTVADGRLGRRTAKNRNVWLWPKSPIPTKSSRIRGRDYQIRISATVVLISPAVSSLTYVTYSSLSRHSTPNSERPKIHL